MLIRRFITSATVLVFLIMLILPAIVLADDVESLKAAFEKEIGFVNANDLEPLMAMQHEQVVAMNPRSADVIDTKAIRRQGYEQLFAGMESFTVTPQNPQYRVVDDTGVVWGTYSISAKPKDGEAATFPARFSRTYVRENGAWQLFLYHVSPVPEGK